MEYDHVMIKKMGLYKNPWIIDIWSLGCIFYEIATLNHAFDAQNMKGLVQKILKGTYPPLPEVYSSDLKKLLSEMLTKDPNKRPSIRKILEMPFMKAKIN